MYLRYFFDRQIYYHILFFPRFDYEVLGEKGEFLLESIFQNICEHYDLNIIEIKISPEYVHLYITANPTLAPVDIVRTLKSLASINLIKSLPQLKKFYGRYGTLWKKEFFITTQPYISEGMINNIIKELKRR